MNFAKVRLCSDPHDGKIAVSNSPSTAANRPSACVKNFLLSTVIAIASLSAGSTYALGFTADSEVIFQESSSPHSWRMVAAGLFVHDGEPRLGIMYETPWGRCTKIDRAVKVGPGTYELQIANVLLRAIEGQSPRDPWAVHALHTDTINGRKMDFEIPTRARQSAGDFDVRTNWAESSCWVAQFFAS